MPEGPEIRREADLIAKRLVGKVIQRIFFGLTRLEPYRTSLIGKTIIQVVTHGKAMMIYFEGGKILYSHNQLYGKWYVSTIGNTPNTNRTLRICLSTDKHNALLYSASEIEVLEQQSLYKHSYLRKLGPDVLSSTTTSVVITERLMDRRFSSRRLSGLYLDQAFIAGIGNYLRSEILYFAGVKPTSRPTDLNKRTVEKLAKYTLSLSVRSYRSGGITNSPSTVESLKRRGEKRSRYRFAVFDRAGEECYRCGEEIQRFEANGRRVYICSTCQHS